VRKGSNRNNKDLRVIISRLQRQVRGLADILVKELDPDELLSIRNQLQCHRKSRIFFERIFGSELGRFEFTAELARYAKRIQMLIECWGQNTDDSLADATALAKLSRLPRRERMRLQRSIVRGMRRELRRMRDGLSEVRNKLIITELRDRIESQAAVATGDVTKEDCAGVQLTDGHGQVDGVAPLDPAASRLTGESTDE
jgi:hypothetical protein